MIVDFDRKKVYKRYVLSNIHMFLWEIVFIFIALISAKSVGYYANSTWYIVFIVCAFLQTGWYIFKSYRITNTRIYEFEGDRHTETYTIITKQRVQARTQVVNNVNITQDFFDKLFNMYNLTVEYGFGDEGYTFTYEKLAEETALDLEKQIKSKGTNVMLK